MMKPTRMTEAMIAVDISEADFLELFESHKETTAKVLSDGGIKGFAPLLDILTVNAQGVKDRIVFGVDMDFNEWSEKAKVMHMVAQKIFDEKRVPVCAILSSECWVSEQKKDANGDFMRPRNDPDRKEAVNVAGMTLMKRQNIGAFSHCLFTRASDDTILSSGKFSENIVEKIGEKLQFNLLQEIADEFCRLGLKKFGAAIAAPNN
jgi:hypothetical protein